MKLLITTLTMIFISFGASALRTIEYSKKPASSAECIKANAVYIGKEDNDRRRQVYAYQGYLYFMWFSFSEGSFTEFDCLRTQTRVYLP